eukprot:TRINITY_DN4418_c0_g4_i1.p1 TRINITY_DN4418_c0_g4~~TRINITY_DN4418_c0_g4_i1.p1  ORF type:complete len:176 (+),score=34.53 TRINITY_DN4418_c0_g4_i1:55-582(+)
MSAPEISRVLNHALKSVPAETYVGQWHLVQSTLPFWTDKRKPRIHYVPIQETSPTPKYQDVATFFEKGFFSSTWTETQVIGTDTQHPTVPTAYEWRGPGWMKILRCEWAFVACEPSEYAILLFGKTLVTPEGLDILYRSPKPDAQTIDKVKAALQAIPEIASVAAQLYFTNQDDI